MLKFSLTLCLLSLTLLALQTAHAEEKKIELKDLGFSADTVKPDENRQNLLEERTHKLKLHEIMGPVTWGLMTATVLTGKEDDVTTFHKTLGILTAASYFTAAYLSLSSPDDPNASEDKEKTNIKIHKALAWVHFPLMVLTPIVGFIAQSQLHSGQKLHGIADQKGNLGVATYIAFSSAFAVTLIEF